MVAAKPDASVDAPAVSDDEKLAAIQKAMNELSPASQQCWAAAAAIRFDLEGELAAQIEIGPPTRVTFVRDTTHSPALAACVQRLLAAYPWAPPLHGEAIQLPFKFSAPAGQSVIDRRLVPFAGQGKLSVAVLLDENNTNNPNVSMFELAIAAGGTTGLRTAPRAELWWFRGEATVRSVTLAATKVSAETMMYVPAGGAREVSAMGAALHAVIVVAPGGPEGAARAGALPTPALTSWLSVPPKPVIITPAQASHAKGHEIFVDPAKMPGVPFSASIATIAAGAEVPEHVHAKETELLYCTSGEGVLTVNGATLVLDDSSVVQIPPNTKHSAIGKVTMRALQIYAPAGPEQRFK
jgi:putative monooxygenase